MFKYLYAVLLAMVFLGCGCGEDNPPDNGPDYNPVAVQKTNPMKVYMHYMPWFHTKEFSGYWGSHWRMNNKNPEIILENGQREIASHYYPLIGPYDSADPDLVDYHLLLMKYVGIDGVLIDWYGSHNVLDYGTNLANSNALVDGLVRTGLEFSLVYEEFTAEEVARRTNFSAIEAAKEDMKYLENTYYSTGQFIRIDGKPLLLTFGPRYFTSKNHWTQILGTLNNEPIFLPLWNHRHRVGDENSDGEFSWVDFTDNLTNLTSFYQDTDNEYIMGSAYPGYHDFYVQGNAGESYGFKDHNDGQTMAETLQKARDFNLDYLQLVTWNDFGEGTMIEPTVEFGYSFLEQIQAFTGVEYDKEILELIYQYYLKRKELKNDTAAQATLDEAFIALIELDTEKAANLIMTL